MPGSPATPGSPEVAASGRNEKGRRKERDLSKWDAMARAGLQRFMAQNPETFLRRVRRGVPDQYRVEVWKAALGYSEMYEAGVYCPELYEQRNQFTEAIAMDVPRTCKSWATRAQREELVAAKPGSDDEPSLREEHEEKLNRVLNAYANLEDSVGYCQGMSFVAGFLLLVCNDEEESFWLLRCLLDRSGLRLFYREPFPLLRQYVAAFTKLFRLTIPDLCSHFENEQVTPHTYCYQWFLTLYINFLPYRAVLAIWDAIICDGLHVVLLVAVALLKVLKTHFLQRNFEEILEFLKTFKHDDIEHADGDLIGQLLLRQAEHVQEGKDQEAILNQLAAADSDAILLDDPLDAIPQERKPESSMLPSFSSFFPSSFFGSDAPKAELRS